MKKDNRKKKGEVLKRKKRKKKTGKERTKEKKKEKRKRKRVHKFLPRVFYFDVGVDDGGLFLSLNFLLIIWSKIYVSMYIYTKGIVAQQKVLWVLKF